MIARPLIPALLGLVLTSFGRTAHAGDLPAHLEVVRSADASLCPDATELAAAISEAVGADAFETTAAAHEGGFAVIFARLDSGFVATIKRDGDHPVARTLAETHGSCAVLGGAVVVALALMLDQLALEPSPAAPPAEVHLPEPPPPPPRLLPVDDAPPKRHWYGWQTLALDGLATGLVSAGVASGGQSNPTSLGLGLVTFALGPPIVHAVHRRWGIFGADIGLRVGTVTMGAVIGAAVTGASGSNGPVCTNYTSSTGSGVSCSGQNPGATGAVVGGYIGAALASAIDATLLSRERVRPPADETPRSGISWLPSLSPASHGATGGIVGAF